MFPRVSGQIYPQCWHCFAASHQKYTKPASFTAEANWECLEMQVAHGSKRVKIWHEVWEPLKWERIEEKRIPWPQKSGNSGTGCLREGLVSLQMGLGWEVGIEVDIVVLAEHLCQGKSPLSLGALGTSALSSQHGCALTSPFLLSFCQAHHVWLSPTSGESISVSPLCSDWKPCLKNLHV